MKNDQVTGAETAIILQLAERCLGEVGDFVELGCYKGDTSVLLGKLLTRYDGPANLSTESPKNSTVFPPKTREFSTNDHKISTESKNFSTSYPQKQELLSTENSELSTKRGNFSTEQTGSDAKSSEKNVKTKRRLWIYDSFAGLPDKTREDNSGAGANFQAGELLVAKREVVEKIRRAGLKNVVIKKAWFDDLTSQDLPGQIAFGFLDGDLYSSIKTSLQLVAPRLTERGIMIVHDYNNPELPGSSRAVDEFLRAHPEYKLQVQHTLAILTR